MRQARGVEEDRKIRTTPEIAPGYEHGGPRFSSYAFPLGTYYKCVMCRSAENTMALFMWWMREHRIVCVREMKEQRNEKG